MGANEENSRKQNNKHSDQHESSGINQRHEAEPSTKAPAITNDDPKLDPFEIEFLPEFREGRGPSAPFVNSYGVVIGDYDYESPNSPLEQWSDETDPAVMAGDEWVHPFKDIGFLTQENRDIFEKGAAPQAGIFMHPEHNAGYRAESDDEGK